MKISKYKLVIGLIILINFLSRLPFLNLPAYSDEMAYFFASRKVFLNNFNPFIEFWSYKPPVFFLLTSLMYKWFGVSRWAGRLIVGLFSSLGIFLTYLLGKKLFNEKIGFWAAVLLFINPLYFTQGSLYHLEIMVTVFFLLILYCYFCEKWIWYILLAGLLVLTKETNVLIIISIAIYDIVINFRRFKADKIISRAGLILSPIILFVIWMLMNKLFLDWYLWPYNFSYFSFSNRPDLRPPLRDFLSVSYWGHFLGVVFSLCFFFLLYSYKKIAKRDDVSKNRILYLFSLAVIFPIIFYFGAFLPRYNLFAYPGLFIAFVWLLDNFLKKRKKMFSLIVMITIFIFSAILVDSIFFKKKSSGWLGERDMSYLHSIGIGQDVINFVIEEFGYSTIILAKWPLESMFEDPFFGYGEKFFKTAIFNNCNSLNSLNRVKQKFLLVSSIEGETEIEECAIRMNLKLKKTIGPVKIYLKE